MPDDSAPVYSRAVALLDPPQPSAEPLEGRLEFETLIADLSSRFINLPPAQVDPEIEDALRRVYELLEIDLAVLWQWSRKDRHVLAPTHTHPQRADGPGAVAVPDEYPWTVAQMLAGRPVVCASLDQLPGEAAVDRESASQAGIKSNLTLPLAVGGEPPLAPWPSARSSRSAPGHPSSCSDSDWSRRSSRTRWPGGARTRHSARPSNG